MAERRRDRDERSTGIDAALTSVYDWVIERVFSPTARMREELQPEVYYGYLHLWKQHEHEMRAELAFLTDVVKRFLDRLKVGDAFLDWSDEVLEHLPAAMNRAVLRHLPTMAFPADFTPPTLMQSLKLTWQFWAKGHRFLDLDWPLISWLRKLWKPQWVQVAKDAGLQALEGAGLAADRVRVGHRTMEGQIERQRMDLATPRSQRRYRLIDEALRIERYEHPGLRNRIRWFLRMLKRGEL